MDIGFLSGCFPARARRPLGPIVLLLVTRVTYHSAQNEFSSICPPEQTQREIRAGPYILTCDPKAQRNAELMETLSLTVSMKLALFHIQQRFMTR